MQISIDTTQFVQFGFVYGHREGSGSLGTKGITGDRTTVVVFGQLNS